MHGELFVYDISILYSIINHLRIFASFSQSSHDDVPDWRADIVKCLMEVYRAECLVLGAERYAMPYYASGDLANLINRFDNQLHQVVSIEVWC